MPEVTAPAAPAPGSNPAPAPNGGQPDSITLSRKEYDELSRSRSNFDGARPYMEGAQKIGIRDPKQFDEYGQLAGVLTKRGMTAAQVAKLLSDEGGADPAAGGDDKPLSRSELDAAIQKLQKDFDGKTAKVGVMGDHKSAKASQEAIRTKILTSILGEKPNEAEKAMFELATEGWFEKNRRFYPDGHPLQSEEFMPHDEASMEPLGKVLKDWRTNLAAANAVRAGDAVNAGRGRSTPSAAGASAPPGKPGEKPQTDTRRERLTELMDSRKAAREKRPVSSLAR